MATTVKNFISTDSLQYEGHITTMNFTFYKTFSKIQHLKHDYCRQFFGQPRLFLTLGVTVPYTINTHEFCPKHHSGLKIQNSITIFRGYLFGFSKFLSTFYFLHAALLA